MAKNGLKAFAQAAINSATDPGVILNLGNTALVIEQNLAAGLANMATSTLCFAVRGVTELRKIGVPIPLPKKFNDIVENPGNALTTSGIVTLGGAAAASGGIDLSQPETALPAAMMTAFGSSNVLRGIATGFETGTIKQNLFDFTGIMSAVAGFYFANPDAPIAVHMSYVASGLMAGYLAIRNRQAHGIMQPDLAFAATSYTNAATSSSPEVILANVLFGTGSVTLDAMKKKGGVVESVMSVFKPDHVIEAEYEEIDEPDLDDDFDLDDEPTEKVEL